MSITANNIHVETIGTGKTDYVTLKKMAESI